MSHAEPGYECEFNNWAQNKGDQCLHYNTKLWKIKSSFDTLKDISEYAALENLMEKLEIWTMQWV